VRRVSRPNTDEFESIVRSGRPVILTDTIAEWPALIGNRAWANPISFRQRVGHRLVPVEVGLHHMHAHCAQQRLMTLSDYIDEYVLRNKPCRVKSSTPVATSEVVPVTAASTAGYLGQHRLFDRVPELARDICEPDYLSRVAKLRPNVHSISRGEDTTTDCSLGTLPTPKYRVIDEFEVAPPPDLPLRPAQRSLVNAWFGGADVVTPLHFDNHSNLLAQVVGSKVLFLYPPESTPYLYAFNASGVRNASSLDPELWETDGKGSLHAASGCSVLVPQGDSEEQNLELKVEWN
jgi:hypothetical protein